jgi:hypothetical protein
LGEVIIDTHTHLGTSKLSGFTVTETDLLGAMGANAVGMALVMPHAVTDNHIEEHDKVAELCRRHPGRFRGIVNLTPLWDEKSYRREATRCVRELSFVAIKLNPMQHLTSPIMANADKVFDCADDLGVPVIVHTGLGAPWAMPSLCIPQARRHPELPIILAHAGFAIYTAEAYVAASECANIYLEPSWCTIHDLHWLFAKVGAGRIMMGSDLPANLPVELCKYRTLNLSEADLDACLCGTAAKVFRL